MTIRTRFSLLLGAAGAAALLAFGLLVTVHQRATAEVIGRLTTERGALFARIIELRGVRLKQFAFDYSYWDPMLTYLKAPREEWARSNLRETMPAYETDYLWIKQLSGETVYATEIPAEGRPAFPLSPPEVIALTAQTPFPHFFVATSDGLLEVRGAPVQPTADSARKTPPQGWFFVGQRWDRAYLDSFGKLLQGTVRFFPAGTAVPPADPQRVVRAQRTLTDWQGRALGQIVTDHEPQLLALLERGRLLEVGILVVGSLVTLLALSLALHAWVLRPLRALDASLARGSAAALEPLIAQRTEFGPLAGRIAAAFREHHELEREITERRRVEAELRASEVRYRTLFENALVGVHGSAPDGRLLAANPEFLRLFGCASAADFSPDCYVVPRRRQTLLAELLVHDAIANFESEVRLRDGTTRWISEGARAIRDSAGKITRVEGFVMDITPRRQLEAEMQRASKLESVGVLAGGIAHDFNNLLSVITGNLSLAEASAASPDRTASFLRKAAAGARRARDLTQQLLTFARGGAPVRATVDLGALLRESAEFALHGSACRADFRLTPGLWLSDADKGQIGQALHNICLNATQAMSGGGTITLTGANHTLTGPGSDTPFLPAGRYVCLSVTDTGPGIAPENLPRIFDPYFTTKAGGTGLGLAVAYSVVRKHGGLITVESKVGRGTSFHIWLPASASVIAEPVAVEPVGLPPLRRVLVMDDEPAVLEVLKLAVEHLGATCDLALDGASAVEKFRATRATGAAYDLVIMDLTVPGGMGGREALQHMQAIDPAVRAIVSSGYSQDPVMASHRAYGFHGVLPKPYTLEELIAALRVAV